MNHRTSSAPSFPKSPTCASRLIHVTQNSALAMTGTETTRFAIGLRCDPPTAAQSRTRRQETIAADDAAELTPVGVKYSFMLRSAGGDNILFGAPGWFVRR